MALYNNDGYVSGFYFDQQMNNPLTSVTLHKNMVEGGSSPRFWEKSARDDPDASGLYDKSPIARAIISDDFEVVINNNFPDFGGDAVGSTLTNLTGSLGPYMRYGSQIINNIKKQTSEYRQTEGFGWATSKISEGINTAKDAANGFLSNVFPEGVTISDISNYMMNSFNAGNAFMLQGTRFKYYAGTDINYGNLSMRFYYFSEFQGNNFVSAYEQLTPLLPYIVGKLQDVTAQKPPVGDFIGQFAKWQSPPAGYLADMKDVDTVQDGTLRMIIGCYYCIESLVVQSASLRFSKQMVKHPEDYGEICPLMCEVTLMLTPASKSSNKSLERFVSGLGTCNRREEQVRSKIASTISPS